MKEHHKVPVIRIEQVLPHPNADKLEIVPIEGYQAVVAKGQFKVGDLAYYIPPDSIVPDREEFSFLWGGATYEGGTPERKRRIGAKKLRGEWSEGVLMSVPIVGDVWPTGWVTKPDGAAQSVGQGNDVAEFLGITHYNPPEPGESTAAGGNEGNLKKRRWPHTITGWISLIKSWLRGEKREGGISLPTYDVEAYKKWVRVFEPGEVVFVTEKIHGSNARFTYRESVLGGKFYVGSRNLWKAEGSTCAWRRAVKDNPWIEEWCRLHPGYSLYGEIVPTQKGYDYGSGCADPKVPKIRFFLFDIRLPDGKWAEIYDPVYTGSDVPGVPSEAYNPLLSALNEARVPWLYTGPWDEAKIKSLVDGKSTVYGAKHIREGVVIKTVPERTVRNLGRVQLKIVSNEFLAKEIKEAA